MEDTDKQISENVEKILKKIRETRKIKGLSHENMAHELNMSSSAYNKLERSETTLSLERLLKIKEILELPFSDLFEINNRDVYNQDLKDRSIGIGSVNNLYQDTNEKFIISLQDEIKFLREQLNKK
jgi:transcriptional regulator with XRE-family HTH domain